MPWEGRFLVIAHASSGDIYIFEVGEKLNLEKHWGLLYDSTDEDPDYTRSGAPFFMQDDNDRWHMFYEGGKRLHANIQHATEDIIPTHTITAAAGSGGSISPQGAVVVNEGENQVFDITPDKGYEIDKIFVDGAEVAVSSSYTFSDVRENHIITVSFKAVETGATYHKISATAESGGSINPSGSVSVASGGNQQFIFSPDAGYKVSSILVDGAESPANMSYTFTNVTAAHSIVVSFVLSEKPQETFTITATAGSGGSISPAGITTLNKGEFKTYIVTPDKGYEVGVLVVDGVSVGAISSYTFTSISGNHTINVTFKKQAEITVVKLDYSGGTTGSSGSTGSNVPDKPAVTVGQGNAVIAGNMLENTAGEKLVKDEVAKNKGAVSVRLVNTKVIPQETLTAMKNAGGSQQITILADSMSTKGNRVDVRLSVDLRKMSKTIDVSASTENQVAESVKNLFKKYFSNNVTVLDIANNGDFESPAEVAVKIELGINTDNLVIQKYSAQTNQYVKVGGSHWLDSNGYLHFTAGGGGTYVISESELVKK